MNLDDLIQQREIKWWTLRPSCEFHSPTWSGLVLTVVMQDVRWHVGDEIRGADLDACLAQLESSLQAMRHVTLTHIESFQRYLTSLDLKGKIVL